MSTLVLGIGNTLLSDEGVGVHATHYLSTHYSELPDTQFLDGGTLSFTLTGPIEESQNLIVIDAAQLNCDPGTVQTFIGEEMDDYLNGQTRRSVHEVGLMDLIWMVRLTGRLPGNRALIGIQPNVIDWGESPTDEVQDAIPAACAIVQQLVEEWRQ
ncbi:MAG: HyaD/HybD family hydrogenase maturation endopeptidase [Gammaproteobacteria bacterium]|jgi:hydrogenase maturation protease